MYAEGDHLEISNQAASFLKKALFDLVTMFEVVRPDMSAAKPEMKEPLPPSKSSLNRVSLKSKKIKKKKKVRRSSEESEYEVTHSEEDEEEEVFN